MLAKVRHYVPNELMSIYHALFSSHLKYGSQIWAQTKYSYVNKVFLLQKAAIKIITFSTFSAHTSPLFKEKCILKLNDYVTLENCLFVYDFLNGSLPLSFKDYFKTLNEVYHSNVVTRSAKRGQLHVPSDKSTKHGLNSIKRKATIAWNYFSKTFD